MTLPVGLDGIDLPGSLSWVPGEQEEAHLLLEEFQDVFSWHDLNVGETSLVEHVFRLKLNVGALFKEQYQPVPPGMYDEVRVHLKENLDIRAIRLSSSLWASAVKLVRKKDGNSVSV